MQYFPKKRFTRSERERVKGGAWDFSFLWGLQDASGKGSNPRYALVVRDEDLASVIEPTTILLLGFGIIGLAGFRKRLKRI